MQRLLSLALALPAVAAAMTTTVRRLEDYDMNGYFKFSKCLRVKIVEDNDDDGNAYFYNGAYRSQSLAYASFVKCDSCDSSCDITTAYVAELDGVLEEALGYSQGYCQACAAACRRRLDEEAEDEDEGNEYNFNVNCKTCSDECYYMNNAGNGMDESEYLDCQYQFTDDEGLDYYGAPTCSANGLMTMGLFYDGTW